MRFGLYIKLGVIQGLTWAAGVIAASTGIQMLWYPFTVLDALQGGYIFFAFDLKKKVKKYRRSFFI